MRSAKRSLGDALPLHLLAQLSGDHVRQRLSVGGFSDALLTKKGAMFSQEVFTNAT
jgi:hypothetical protein